MGNAPDTSEYVLATSDTSLANAKVLAVAAGLQLNVTTSQIQIQPVSYLGSLQSLSATGLLAATASGVITPRSLTSTGTINITNPQGVAGNPVLDVIDDTSIQKVNIMSGGNTILATRQTLNFIATNGTNVTVQDNGSATPPRVDIEIGTNQVFTNASYVTANDETAILPNSYKLAGGGGVTLTKGNNIITISSGTTGFSQYFDQSLLTDPEFYSSTIGPIGAENNIGSYVCTPPNEKLLNLIQNGGTGILQVTANINLSLLFSGTVPFTIGYDVTTDVNPPVPDTIGQYGQTIYTNSNISTTALIMIRKPLSEIAGGPAATTLVIWVRNPDSQNSMSLQNFCTHVTVEWLPNGFTS